jgi:hypothetical protein
VIGLVRSADHDAEIAKLRADADADRRDLLNRLEAARSDAEVAASHALRLEHEVESMRAQIDNHEQEMRQAAFVVYGLLPKGVAEWDEWMAEQAMPSEQEQTA